MKHIRIFLATLAIFMGFGAMVPSVALAASPKSTVCQTLGDGNDCGGTPSNGIGLNHLIKTVVNILSLVVGIAAVIMIIVGGFRYITSGGDSNNVSAAKNTILYALVGLVIVAMAQFIVQFVLGKATGAG